VFLKSGFGVCMGSKAARAYPKIIFSPAFAGVRGWGKQGFLTLRKPWGELRMGREDKISWYNTTNRLKLRLYCSVGSLKGGD